MNISIPKFDYGAIVFIWGKIWKLHHRLFSMSMLLWHIKNITHVWIRFFDSYDLTGYIFRKHFSWCYVSISKRQEKTACGEGSSFPWRQYRDQCGEASWLVKRSRPTWVKSDPRGADQYWTQKRHRASSWEN